MIQDILTAPREENQKPKFFLHEEMKVWLADNMDVSTIIQSMGYKYVASIACMDEPVYSRYQENVALPTGFNISSVARIDGIPIIFNTSYIDLAPIVNVIDTLTKRVHELETVRSNDVVQLIANQIVMQDEIVELKKQLDGKA